jgi:hypothetical protein
LKALAQPWEFVVWAINIGLLAGFAYLLFRYRHQRDFPAFTSYVTFSFIKEVALFAMSLAFGFRPYFIAYWIGQLFTLAFLVLIIHEVFMSVTERAKWLPRRTRKILIRMALGAALILIGTSLNVRDDGRFQIVGGLIALQRGVMLAVLAFMFVLIAFTRRFHVPWFRRDAGIALGIVVSFSFETLWPKVGAFLVGNPQAEIYRQVVPCFYTLGTIIWIYSFYRASFLAEEEDEFAKRAKMPSSEKLENHLQFASS